jgi:anaerobic magnesium-protoporphyrin IX monomethyl ester cyclase
MDVLLAHAYFIAEDATEQAIMKPYPPLGILYLSAFLERHGIDHAVFDTTFSTKAAFKQYLLAHKPRILALYTNLVTKLQVLELIAWVRTEPSLADMVIVQGGPDITHNTAEYLGEGAHVVVVGEGEQTMLEIAQTVLYQGNTTEFGHIQGVVYRAASGDIIRTGVRTKIKNIDELPFPNRGKIDLMQYLNVWKERHGKSTVSVSTQRGCPYTCKWCSTAVYGQSYRRMSPKRVVDELEHIRRVYNPDAIWFVDDVFTVSHKWLDEFCDEVHARQICLPFECITRADRLTEAVVATLKKAGCFRVWIGAESGSQQVIDAMDRRVDVLQVRRMIQCARTHGIETGTFIMLGYPHETEADIEETIVHLKEANPDIFTITIAYPIKGTGLYSEVEASSFSSLPWNKRTDREVDFARTYPKPYYHYAVRRVVNEVNYYKQTRNGMPYTLAAWKMWVRYQLAKLGMWYYRRGA